MKWGKFCVGTLTKNLKVCVSKYFEKPLHRNMKTCNLVCCHKYKLHILR